MNRRRMPLFFLCAVFFRCGSVHFAHQPRSGEAIEQEFAHFYAKPEV
jgi:hypothetical protein